MSRKWFVSYRKWKAVMKFIGKKNHNVFVEKIHICCRGRVFTLDLCLLPLLSCHPSDVDSKETARLGWRGVKWPRKLGTLARHTPGTTPSSLLTGASALSSWWPCDESQVAVLR